jgi:hypothetical protein
VYSPDERVSKVLFWVADCLEAGVRVVCVLDQASERIHLFRGEELPPPLHNSDELHLPDILGDFRVPVQRFFE